MTKYHNQTGTVPIGETYESVTIPEIGTIQTGDMIVWSDPDHYYHNEDSTCSLFIGSITTIYKFTGKTIDRKPVPEISTSCPLGRLSFDRHLKAINGKEVTDGHKCDMKFIDRFLSSECDKYMNIEYTRSGDIRVSGE